MTRSSHVLGRAGVLLCLPLILLCFRGCGKQRLGKAQQVVGAEGYYRLVKEEGTWWFLDPQGERFVSLGINHIEPVLVVSESNKEIFTKKYGQDLVGPGGFGDPHSGAAKKWLADSMKLIREWGFNTLGVHNPIPQQEMGWVAKFRPTPIDGWAGLDRKYMDPFDPATVKFVGEEARDWCGQHASDVNIIGVSFNDMPELYTSPARVHPWVEHIMSLESGSPGKRKWVDVVESHYGDVATAAKAYGIAAGGWDEFLERTDWPTPLQPWFVHEDVVAFLPLVVDEWYSVMVAAVRKCDPNHLIFGDKLEGAFDMPPWLDPLVGKHFDVAFIQWYEYADRQIPRLDELHEVSGKPVLMGDSAFSAPTRSVESPKGVHVGSQEHVGMAYAEYLESILARPYVVGWHHCGFIEGSADLERFHPYFAIQPGLLEPDGTPHEETITRVTAANSKARDWHASPSEGAKLASSPLYRFKKGYDRCYTQGRRFYNLTRIDNNVYNIGGITVGRGKVPNKNISFVVTSEGVVVIDSGLLWTGTYAKAVIRAMTGKPIKYIIYTHHHGTQVAGAEAIRDPGTKIIAHEDTVLEFDLRHKFSQMHKERNAIQFDMPPEVKLQEFRYPDITFADEHEFTLGGTKFELYHVEGEAQDYAVVFLPEQKIVWVADLIGPSVPLVASPMKRVRDEVKWKKGLKLIKSLRPEVLVASVRPPICGGLVIDAKLGAHIGYLGFLHDAVAEEMNIDSSLEEAIEHILEKQGPFVGNLDEGYGSTYMNVRGLYHRYSGWFDRNGTHLSPPPSKLKAQSFVDDMGGLKKVRARARELHAEGESALALEYLDLLITLDDGDEEAHLLKGTILDEMGDTTGLNPLMKNMFENLAKAEKLKGGAASP